MVEIIELWLWSPKRQETIETRWKHNIVTLSGGAMWRLYAEFCVATIWRTLNSLTSKSWQHWREATNMKDFEFSYIEVTWVFGILEMWKVINTDIKYIQHCHTPFHLISSFVYSLKLNTISFHHFHMILNCFMSLELNI